MTSKYNGLRTFLESLPVEPITLTLRKIDGLVGGLPRSAREYREFWSDGHGSAHAAAWLEAGWSVEAVDLSAQTVRFRPSRSSRVPSATPPVEPTVDVSPERAHAAAVDRPLPVGGRLIDWPQVWRDLASRLTTDIHGGRVHLLTEDSVRRALIASLEEAGVPPTDLRIEVNEPRVEGKLDLVIGHHPGEVVFELKFPRDSKAGASPDTMTMGEMLRDFCRLARLDAPERWAVQLVGARLRRYLERRTEFRWTLTPGDRFEVRIDDWQKLPATALGHVPAWALDLPVAATCEAAVDLPEATLVAYRVD